MGHNIASLSGILENNKEKTQRERPTQGKCYGLLYYYRFHPSAKHYSIHLRII